MSFVEAFRNVMARRISLDTLGEYIQESGEWTPEFTFATPGDLISQVPSNLVDAEDRFEILHQKQYKVI